MFVLATIAILQAVAQFLVEECGLIYSIPLFLTPSFCQNLRAFVFQCCDEQSCLNEVVCNGEWRLKSKISESYTAIMIDMK